jgi:hypothetical protein
MIYLETNSITPIALELSQTLPSSNTFFLFEFIWEEVPQQAPRYLYTPTIVNSTRFSLFNISVFDAPIGSLTNANVIPIDLNLGQYKYNIYSGFNSPDFSNLAPFIAASGIVTTGRMVVKSLTPTGIYPGQVLATTPNVYA